MNGREMRNKRDGEHTGLRGEFYRDRREHFLFIVSLLIAAGLSAFLLNFFLELTGKLQQDQLTPMDQAFTAWIYAFRSETLTPLVTFITHLGDAWAYVIIVPVIGGFLYFRGYTWRLIIQGVLVLLSASLLNVWIKNEISRPRPAEAERLVEAHSFSFPSGHSMSAIAFYGFLIYLTFKLVENRFLRYTLILFEILLILSIGMSRIYLGVHYPSDVLAGFTAGLFWLLICIALFRSIRFYGGKNLTTKK